RARRAEHGARGQARPDQQARSEIRKGIVRYSGGPMTPSLVARPSVRGVFVALVVSLAAGRSSAQQLDRSKRPEIPPKAPLSFPSVGVRTLANGLSVRIVENHALPLVAVRVAIESGSLLDPEGKEGLFTLDTLLIRDGTKSMTGDQLAQAVDEL